MKKIILIISGIIFLYSFKTNKEKEIKANLDYRPIYHFSSDSNWINDPNGLIFHNGEYHLFYQYNPFGTKWGHMSWGHSVSKDLMNWQKLPVALYEDKNLKDNDSSMIFSGSAVIDKKNTSGFGTVQNPPMVAIYTSFVHRGRFNGNDYTEIAQSQSLAYSTDNGRSWSKYSDNPVLDIHSLEYRDPKVFWYEPQQKWVLALVKSDRQEVWFYESRNLKNWNYMSRWGRAGNTATVWECPDLFEMTVEGANEKKWVLIVSAGHPQEKFPGMQYFVGDFDGKKFTPVKDYLEPVYLDYGKDFYAGITYNDMPDNRRVLVAWLNNWVYAREIPTSDTWRGLFSVPRELSLVKNKSEFNLIQKPVAEMVAIRKEVLKQDEQTIDSSKQISFNKASYEIEFEIEPGNAKQAGIKIFKGKNEETNIYYDAASGSLLFDRTKSGNVAFSHWFPSIEKAPVSLKDGKLKIRILVDKCVAEVFVNDGEVTLTDLVFPEEKDGTIELFSKGGESVFRSLKIWEIVPVNK